MRGGPCQCRSRSSCGRSSWRRRPGTGGRVRALAGRLLRRLRAGEPLMPDAGLEAALALRDVRAFDLLEELGQVLRRNAVMNGIR